MPIRAYCATCRVAKRKHCSWNPKACARYKVDQEAKARRLKRNGPDDWRRETR